MLCNIYFILIYWSEMFCRVAILDRCVLCFTPADCYRLWRVGTSLVIDAVLGNGSFSLEWRPWYACGMKNLMVWNFDLRYTTTDSRQIGIIDYCTSLNYDLLWIDDEIEEGCDPCCCTGSRWIDRRRIKRWSHSRVGWPGASPVSIWFNSITF